MEKKTIIIILLAMILILAAIIILVSRPQLSPTSNSNLETCNSISYASSSAINLVFLSTQEQAKEYSDYLETISPYNKDSFNIYQIEDNQNCDLYQNKAVFCYSKELVKKASSCPNDIIIAITSHPASIRSSAYMNVISINSNNNKNVLAHELGHALAFLADEYVPATLPKKSENCQKTCTFKPCFQGCSNEDYYRSIDNGIMKTLSSSDYGDYNKNLISKYLPSNSITGHAIEETQECSNQEYYLIQGNYSEDKIQVISKSIEPGCIGNTGVGDFSYNLILDNNLNFTGNFNPEFIFTDSDSEGGVLISDGLFFLKIPIIENAKTLEIIKENKIAEINLQEDSRPCRI